MVKPGGTVTAGNASGVNDGAAAMFVASEAAAKRHGLTPRARILGLASAGVEPDVMGIGPVKAVGKLLHRLKLTLDDVELIELNEAFASQSVACLRELGVRPDDPRVNPHGGAIALGHPLGMSGARLVDRPPSTGWSPRRPAAPWLHCASAWGRGSPSWWRRSEYDGSRSLFA